MKPIRDKKAIARIKKILADRPRDLCLFTLGINTAYRANELLSLKVGQVKNLQAGDVLDLKQRKTHKYRPVTLNATAVAAIQAWLASGDLKADAYLFTGQRGCLTVETELTRRRPTGSTTVTFNAQQNPLNTAADWTKKFPAAGTAGHPTVVQVTNGGLTILAGVNLSHTIITVVNGDIN